MANTEQQDVKKISLDSHGIQAVLEMGGAPTKLLF